MMPVQLASDTLALPSMAEELTDDPSPPISATGGKTPWEYMYSGLSVITDIVRSAFPVSEPILYRRACVLGSSNSMLGRASTTAKINRNGVALAGEQSVSAGHQRHPSLCPSGFWRFLTDADLPAARIPHLGIRLAGHAADADEVGVPSRTAYQQFSWRQW
jgi:hypothetical protein